MTSKGILMAKTKELRQTAVRLTPELLRLAKYYLDEENSNLQKFLSEQLEHYVERRTQEKKRRATIA